MVGGLRTECSGETPVLPLMASPDPRAITIQFKANALMDIPLSMLDVNPLVRLISKGCTK